MFEISPRSFPAAERRTKERLKEELKTLRRLPQRRFAAWRREQLERLTSLDFFHLFPVELEESLESSLNKELWPGLD